MLLIIGSRREIAAKNFTGAQHLFRKSCERILQFMMKQAIQLKS